jgi:hypothetical protein
MTTLEIYRECLELRKESATKEVTSWARKFADNPASALEWSDKIFDEAAALQVIAQVEMMLENKATLGGVKQALEKMALRGARWPEHSTSVASNRMHQALTAAYAIMADDVPSEQGK